MYKISAKKSEKNESMDIKVGGQVVATVTVRPDGRVDTYVYTNDQHNINFARTTVNNGDATTIAYGGEVEVKSRVKKYTVEK